MIHVEGNEKKKSRERPKFTLVKVFKNNMSIAKSSKEYDFRYNRMEIKNTSGQP